MGESNKMRQKEKARLVYSNIQVKGGVSEGSMSNVKPFTEMSINAVGAKPAFPHLLSSVCSQNFQLPEPASL